MSKCFANSLRDVYKQLIAETLDVRMKVSIFLPVEGEKYRESREKNDSNIRLMLIGRSPNGWSDCDLRDGVDESLAKIITTMDWLDDKGVDKNGYIASNKAFWYCTKAVLERLAPKLKDVNRWFEYICWSNLYPISPIEGGNPTDDFKRVQLTAALKILECQLDYYKPTHILFMTGWKASGETWFGDFAELFTDISGVDKICLIPNLNDEAAKINGMKPLVVAKGKYKNIPVVVTSRPDRMRNKPKKEEYVNQVCAAFDEIEKTK